MIRLSVPFFYLVVGHAVASHIAEGLTKTLWFAILHLILFQFASRDMVIVNTMASVFLRLTFSRQYNLVHVFLISQFPLWFFDYTCCILLNIMFAITVKIV
ncbi:hypothetical protein S83_056566 [Arachis hypogaea]